jgi:hypothetical protein
MVADESGVMRQRQRRTQISVFEAMSGETAHLYEMGLPIVETGDKWHVNVHQKIPLNRDRSNVTPAFLRAVRTLVVNATSERLTEDDANAVWVRQASSNSDCSPEAIKRVLDLRFGEKRAAYDPSDPEANKTFVSQGGVIVTGSMLSGQEWANAKAAEAIAPAGKLCPTPKPYSDDPDAEPVKMLPESEWSEGMRNIAAYAKWLAVELMGVSITVKVVDTRNNFIAAYGHRTLDFNVKRLGWKWFDGGASAAADELLIHEFGHEYSPDHLSSDYHDALCRLGAKLKSLSMRQPEAMRRFME